jgi:hypothetical protein
MQIRLYLDEDSMSRSLVRELRARGIDVTTALEVGTLGYDDASQLEFAKSCGRVIYTYNVSDYYNLHTEYMAENKSHAGIILVHQQRHAIGDQIRRLLKLMSERSAEDMQDNVEFLSAWG